VPPFYFHFSFDFGDPTFEFEQLRFAFRIFTPSNVYGLDPAALGVERAPDRLKITAGGLTWAGGQERSGGRFEAVIEKEGEAIQWEAHAWLSEPVKSVGTVIRGLPFGRVAPCQAGYLASQAQELLFCYPPAHTNYGEMLYSPLLLIETGTEELLYVHSLDKVVRPKRFYLRAEDGQFYAELVVEERASDWKPSFHTPRWRLARCEHPAQAYTAHQAHVAEAFHLIPWAERTDVPAWARDIRLAINLHGVHWTGYIFNTYERMLEILRWVAKQIDPQQVLVYLPGWDGRYYWNYPQYEPDPRCGGREGFRRLTAETRSLGFHLMPMFGMNIANAKQTTFDHLSEAMARFPDGNPYWANWIDWDNDRSLETWMALMNIGAPTWRDWLEERICRVVDDFAVEAVFLDISLFWLNDPRFDMYHGTCELVSSLRRKYPALLLAGEAWYDAVLGLFPICQTIPPPLYPQFLTRYIRAVAHLRHPAPGRGSTGVHEQGLRGFNQTTLELNPGQIPTLAVVDDTFDQHRDIMEAIICRAKKEASDEKGKEVH
jgi:hypothetical protein